MAWTAALLGLVVMTVPDCVAAPISPSASAAAQSNPAQPPAPEPAQEPQAAPQTLPVAVESPVTEAQPTYPNRLLHGFGDVVFSTTGGGAGRRFSLGQLIFQYSSALSPRTFVFTEVSFTPRGDAGTSGVTPNNVDVERLFFRYDVNDRLKVSAGRYHTPINWWNTAYHHGLWLQTTISRPEMTRFGGQFIPVHLVGGLIEGVLPAGGLNLNYNVGVGNGRSNITRGGETGDVNTEPAGLINLFVRPDRFYRLQVGASAYRDNVVLAPGNRKIEEWILSGHVVYQKEDPEIIAEYARVNHKETGAPSANSEAYYVQIAYRLNRARSPLKPYYRYERIRIPASDPVFTPSTTATLSGNTVGLRYDFSDLATLKLEYRDFQRRAPAVDTTGVFAQVAFTF